jgi:hypothetical protein
LAATRRGTTRGLGGRPVAEEAREEGAPVIHEGPSRASSRHAPPCAVMGEIAREKAQPLRRWGVGARSGLPGR